jgi:hypothetical protein
MTKQETSKFIESLNTSVQWTMLNFLENVSKNREFDKRVEMELELFTSGDIARFFPFLFQIKLVIK